MNVIITGASKGIGKAIAEIFAANGHNVFICSRGELGLYKTMEELTTQYPSVTIKAKPCDVRNKDDVKEFGKWCLQQGSPDILVNNAGNFTGSNVHDEVEGSLEEMIETNLYSAYYLTRIIVPEMKKKKGGHIFNMSSIAALKAYPGGGSYSISKFALHGFSINLREEMKPYNIKVTTILPGAVYTDSWAGQVKKDRIMDVDDVAKMVFAASQLSPAACVEEIVVRPQLGDL